MKRLKVLQFALLMLVFSNLFPADSPFQELDTIKIQFGENLFTKIGGVEAFPGGFIFLLSRGRQNNLIVIVDKSGKIKHVYDKAGNGPGELRDAFNVTSANGYIYACESESSYVHQYTSELKFVKDFRIKRAGKLFVLKDNQFGVWGPNYTDDGAFQLALYDENFNFKRYEYHVKEIPNLFHFWGGIVNGPENTYAVFYPNSYQIKLFDTDWKLKKSVVKQVPPHIIPYKKYTRNPSHVDNSTVEWSKSWSVLWSLFYSKGKYFVSYLYQSKVFVDVLDEEGRIILKNFQDPKGYHLSFIDHDGELWKLRTENIDEDFPEYCLVKVRFSN